MKKLIFGLIFAFALCACESATDLSEVNERLDSLEQRMSAAEALLKANENGLYIVSVQQITDGYVFFMSDGSQVAVYNGKDGQNGQNGSNAKALVESITIGDDAVTFVLSDGRTFSLPLRSTLSIEFDKADLSAIDDDSEQNVHYTIHSNLTDNITIEVVTSADILAEVVKESATTGYITIITTTVTKYSRVLVFVSNGEKTITKSVPLDGTVDDEGQDNEGDDNGGDNGDEEGDGNEDNNGGDENSDNDEENGSDEPNAPSYDGSYFTEDYADLDMKMIFVEGGSFEMGATEEQGSDYNSDELPVHTVTLDSFYIGECEVTQAQWYKVMGTTIYEQAGKVSSYPAYPYYGVGDNYPMYFVNYDEALEFCSKLSELTGRTYTLPTEAEWEYAARGGKNNDGTKYSGSNTIGDVAWYLSNASSSTHPVAQKQPNGLGLYDMSGNVYEWCSDRYSDTYYSESSTENPAGPSSGSYRVLRGGSWSNSDDYCRVSHRFYYTPDTRYDNIGFRVVVLL